MELEFAIQPDIDEVYPFEIADGSPCVVDWAPMIPEILIDLQKGQSAGIISAKFHNTLVEIIVAVARKVGEPKVVLTGGCFQNRYLIERSVRQTVGCRLQAVLASTRAAERRRDCARPGRCRRSIRFGRSTAERSRSPMNLVYGEIVEVS